MIDHTKLEAAIESFDKSRDFSMNFYDFLDLVLSMFCNNVDERQKDVNYRLSGDNDSRAKVAEALRIYGDLAEDYHDPFGDVFMSRISNGANGQFFTPEGITNLITEIMKPQRDSVYDPACGSGRTLLSALRYARTHGGDISCCGGDISDTCSKMTLVNLLMNQARGFVYTGNTLLQDFDKYRFYKIDRIRMLGVTVSTYWQYTTATLDSVNEERNKWLYDLLQKGWMLDYTTSDKTEQVCEAVQLPTRVETTESGQLSLIF